MGEMTTHGRAREAMGAKVKPEVGTVVKEEEADKESGRVGFVEDIGAALRTSVREVVPSSTLSKARAVQWLPWALGKEPPALDTPCSGGP